MTDFFISYNRADRAWAEWIAWQLEAAGYRAVIQTRDLREGDKGTLDLQRAMQDAKRTLIVLSPGFLASQFTALEWAAAFAPDSDSAKGRMAAVQVRECQPKGLLAQIDCIDLVGLPDRAAATRRLHAAVATWCVKPGAGPAPRAWAPGRLRAGAGGSKPSKPEPPWPPAPVRRSPVNGSRFRYALRRVRMVAMAALVAWVVLRLLRAAAPEWFAVNPGAIYGMSLLWGVLVAMGIEGAWRLWRGRTIQAGP